MYVAAIRTHNIQNTSVSHRHLIKQTADWFELHRLSMYNEKWHQVPNHNKKNRKEGGGFVPASTIFSAQSALCLWVGKQHHFWQWTGGEVNWLCRQAGQANNQSTYLDVYGLGAESSVSLSFLSDKAFPISVETTLSFAPSSVIRFSYSEWAFNR